MSDIRINGNAAYLREFVPAYPDKNQWLHYWNTPEAFAAHVATIDCTKTWADRAWDDDAKQRGTSSMSEALELCRTGWGKGAKRAAVLRDRINAANPIGPRLIKYDVAGAYPFVPRALAGNPLNMRRVDGARLRRRPVITLLSDASVAWTTKAESMERRAAVVAAIVDAIESAGYACQVIAVCASGDPGLIWSVSTQIKESTQQADIGRLAFALGHPSYFRRLAFAIAVEDRLTEPLGSALGIPCGVKISDAMRDRNVFNLPSCNKSAERHFESDDIAATDGLKFIIDALTEQNCPAFPQESDRTA